MSDKQTELSVESNTLQGITHHLYKRERRERILQRGDLSRVPYGVPIDEGVLRDDCYRADIQHG